MDKEYELVRRANAVSKILIKCRDDVEEIAGMAAEADLGEGHMVNASRFIGEATMEIRLALMHKFVKPDCKTEFYPDE